MGQNHLEFFWKRRNDPAIKPRKRLHHFLGIPFNELVQPKIALWNFFENAGFVKNDRFYVMDVQLYFNFVIPYERLEEGLSEICKNVGIPPFKLPHLKTDFRQ